MDPTDPEAVRFCASGALLRAAFDVTGETRRAYEVRYAACALLLPHAETPQDVLEHINDSSIGYVCVMQIFDSFLDDG